MLSNVFYRANFREAQVRPAKFSISAGKTFVSNFFLLIKVLHSSRVVIMARLAAGKSKVYQQSSDEEEYESAFHTFDDHEEEVMFGNVVHRCINGPDIDGFDQGFGI
jgi:hypothetical protein